MTQTLTDAIHADQVAPLTNKGGRIKVTISPKTVQSTQLIMGQLVLQAGESLLEHVHDYGEEAFYVVSGMGTAYLEGKAIELSPDVSVLVRKGLRHRMENTGSDALVILFATAPLAPTAAAGDRVTAQ
ncbi:cupin domain-containing protein [Gorillibacterium sp. CAU 1737]|uniref:cupin domain-containing protein n=1 Tax=Gorillibacterium sp. CAU 1737 TaxID=3140362 RepID=UPI003261781B